MISTIRQHFEGILVLFHSGSGQEEEGDEGDDALALYILPMWCWTTSLCFYGRRESKGYHCYEIRCSETFRLACLLLKHVICLLTAPEVRITDRPSVPFADVQDAQDPLVGDRRRPRQSAVAQARHVSMCLLLCHHRQCCLARPSAPWCHHPPRICHPPCHPPWVRSVVAPAVPVAASLAARPRPQGLPFVHPRRRRRDPETTESRPSPSASAPSRAPDPRPPPRRTCPTGPGARPGRASWRGPRPRWPS